MQLRSKADARIMRRGSSLNVRAGSSGVRMILSRQVLLPVERIEQLAIIGFVEADSQCVDGKNRGAADRLPAMPGATSGLRLFSL